MIFLKVQHDKSGYETGKFKLSFFVQLPMFFFVGTDPLNLQILALREIKIRRRLEVVFATKLSGSQAPLAVLNKRLGPSKSSAAQGD
jgi:hypothetical protein